MTDSKDEAIRTSALAPGDKAPDFELPDQASGRISLKEYRGQAVVLVFYPADNSPVCSNQLALYNEALPLLTESGAQLMAISVDDVASHREFADELGLRFPLLADSDPQGLVTRQYGVYDEQQRLSQRALFVVDPQGFISWSHVSPMSVNPGAHGILAALESLERWQ